MQYQFVYFAESFVFFKGVKIPRQVTITWNDFFFTVLLMRAWLIAMASQHHFTGIWGHVSEEHDHGFAYLSPVIRFLHRHMTKNLSMTFNPSTQSPVLSSIFGQHYFVYTNTINTFWGVLMKVYLQIQLKSMYKLHLKYVLQIVSMRELFLLISWSTCIRYVDTLSSHHFLLAAPLLLMKHFIWSGLCSLCGLWSEL